VPRGYRDFQRPVSIADTLDYLTHTTLFERVDVRRAVVEIYGADYKLYEVPSGKRAMLMTAVMNCRHWAAGVHRAILYLYDGAKMHEIMIFYAPDAVEHHTIELGGGIVPMPEGWSLWVSANAVTYVSVCCVIVEYG